MKLHGNCQGRQKTFFFWAGKNLPDGHFYNKKSIAQINVIFGDFLEQKGRKLQGKCQGSQKLVFLDWAEKASQMAILQ